MWLWYLPQKWQVRGLGFDLSKNLMNKWMSKSPDLHLCQFLQDGKKVQILSKIFFLKLHCDQTVWFFQDFSTVLKSFCPFLDSFLAHLELKLQLFEVDDHGDAGNDDLTHQHLPNFKHF